MSGNRGAIAAALLAALAACVAGAREARAVPLFAQRYGFACTSCHSVLPELNAFGTAFRNHGYRIAGVPKHGTTILALREQVGYEKDPVDAPRFVPAGGILGAVEAGHVEAFVHETLGSQGGPASLFLGYLAAYDARSGVLFRAGLQELPLVHSPVQRNDTLDVYGYEGSHVGLNDLTLATTRWGIEAERDAGRARLSAMLSFANGGGSAYGGKPVVTGTATGFATPEIGLFSDVRLARWLRGGVDFLAGTRAIAPAGGTRFDDAYQREGAFVDASAGRLELLAEQYYGHDANPAGSGGGILSRGGYVRVRWALGAHAFLGVREDAAATPDETRSLLWYAEAMPTPHTRLLVQQKRPIPGGPTSLEGAFTIGFPW